MVHRLLATSISLLLLGASCEQRGGGGGILGLGQSGGQKWTIRCYRSEAPTHEQDCQRLADLLKQVNGLQGHRVRVAADAKGSTLYYGEYTKVASSDGGRLVFPQDYQNDMALIQHLAINQYPVFRYARPEQIDRTPASAQMSEWNVIHAKGPYTLQIGVFYNTPTFSEARQAAEQYVELLREEGFDAYYRHEPARTFVFVGDFEESDVIRERGNVRYGPRVEQLIARREEEFRHTLENLHIVKHRAPDGQMMVPPSILVPVPRDLPAP